jgi:maltooligosyltrehalose trehalohydrolase
MLAWHRALIHLRRTTPFLQNGEPGNTNVVFDEIKMVFSMVRGELTLCCNLADTDRQFSLQKGSQVILSSRTATQVKEGFLVLEPDTVAIIKSGGAA